MFEREDWTFFRNLDTLCQKAGVYQDRLAMLVAKELVDNALDANPGKQCEIDFPDDSNSIIVTDDGVGIDGDDDTIARLFSINRPTISSKRLRLPTRGALGNGLRVVCGAVVATGGTIEVSTRGRTLRIDVDYATGIGKATRIGAYDKPGVKIRVVLGHDLKVDDSATDWAEEAIEMAVFPSYGGKSSPWWYDSVSWRELLLSHKGPVRDLVAMLDGCTGAKAGKITEPWKGIQSADLNAEDADKLLCRARGMVKNVDPRRLKKIGKGLYGLPGYGRWEGHLNSGRGTFVAKVPMSIEAWCGLCPDSVEDIGFSSYVNRTAITGKLSVWHNRQSSSLRIDGCGLNLRFEKVGKKPFILAVNIDTPYMPITTDGKSPDLSALSGVLRETIGKAISVAKRYAPIAEDKPAPVVRPQSHKAVVYELLPGAIELNRGGKGYRFTPRQLYYSIREEVRERTGKELGWSNFVNKILTEYELENDYIPGLVRDNRGMVYHPHTREEIPLGTLSVERYQRPKWTFNKVLYIEKEGFFPMLQAEKWPERHDCALLTSKGYATRAAKDLLDHLGEGDEPITFYCLHDFDASGTLIYHSLVNATKSRPGRKVNIIDIGFNPEDIGGLPTEKVEKRKARRPVGSHIDPAWAEWLQENRVELNAMEPARFFEWLDKTMEDMGSGKVVPPADVIKARLEDDIRSELRSTITGMILDRADVDGRVDRAFERRRDAVDRAGVDINGKVAVMIADTPFHWTRPVERMAMKLARVKSKRVRQS